jgi:hypothetical protein
MTTQKLFIATMDMLLIISRSKARAAKYGKLEIPM